MKVYLGKSIEKRCQGEISNEKNVKLFKNLNLIINFNIYIFRIMRVVETSSVIQTCKSIPFTGIRVGAIRDEITGGKGRSVTLCPPSGAFYSDRIHVLLHDTSVHVYNLCI